MLCRPDSEARVSNTGLPRVLLRRRNTLDIRIEPFNARGESRHAECEAAIATSEVQDELRAHELLATPLAELVDGARPERRTVRGDVPPDVAEQARRTGAHVPCSLHLPFVTRRRVRSGRREFWSGGRDTGRLKSQGACLSSLRCTDSGRFGRELLVAGDLSLALNSHVDFQPFQPS